MTEKENKDTKYTGSYFAVMEVFSSISSLLVAFKKAIALTYGAVLNGSSCKLLLSISKIMINIM